MRSQRITGLTPDVIAELVAATAPPPTAVPPTSTYDSAGAVTVAVDPTGAVQRSLNDAAGLPIQLTDALGADTFITRDAFGLPVAGTDPLGHTTQVSWTAEGKLASRTLPGALPKSGPGTEKATTSRTGTQPAAVSLPSSTPGSIG